MDLWRSVTSALIDAFTQHFRSGESFPRITDARKFAETIIGEVAPGTKSSKEVDECVEAALVRVAQDIVRESSTSIEAFRKLVDLHDRQPALNVRSSTSVAEQAYSTPVPIAYLATVLARITSDQTIYEPSAGHGALLLGSDPKQVTVNELNPDRAVDLRSQGYAVTENDASQIVPEKLHDIVIMNPPFGIVSDSVGKKQQFQFGDYRTTQIDHAIALKNLQAMKPDGRAVLILGGKLGTDQGTRSDKYNTRESRGFYYSLYQQYKVEEHFSVAGDLYRKQGAGFPIDIIMINGTGKSERPLPASDVPRIYKSFDELGEFLDDFLRRESERLGITAERESSGSASTQPRDEPQRESISGSDDQTTELADRQVDLRSADDSGRHPFATQTEDEEFLDIQQATVLADTRQFTGSAEQMAEPVDTVYRLRERNHTNVADVSGDRIPSASGNEPTEDRGSPGDVPISGRSTESGILAGGSDLPSSPIEQPKQLPYQPKSQARALGTLVPANMQTGLNQALIKLERTVGSLDEYVADRLAYGTVEEVHKYFSAEQVDAIALAVSNLEKGSGFILGDQTGIGKGRVVAGIIRYGKVTGRTPIFITKNPPLYADMIRDLGDIGMPHFRPLVTDENLTLPLPDGRELKTKSKIHREVIKVFQEQGNLGNYDGIFTTYNQLQTVKGKEPERRTFLRTFAPKSLIILDESHEAGGTSNTEIIRTSSVANRADFARELIERSQGVLYSSATYAKNPQVMDLYSRTDMRLALSNMENLTELIASGGVPLQQTLASMLTEAGQYIRRERSFEGVNFEPVVVPVNRDVAENISVIMSEIMQFDQMKDKVVKGMDKELKSEAKKSFGDNSTGGAGATSINFTSIMHNVIDQMLFALKAEETVQKTLELLKKPNPEKPVLTLSNTMGSLIARQAQDQGLQPGDKMDVDFGTLLHRYLDRSRDVIIGNPYGEKKRHHLTEAELGTATTNKYNSIQRLINETNFDGIPVSPIDYITFRLTQEGYRVGEVTGREHIANYDVEGNLTYQRRSNQERSKANVVQTVKSFNEGHLDLIILNRSGSTGISLHASEKFSDQRQRHMVVVQSERDINAFMQMLGRVHRTGQVVPPNFTLLMGDVPAEKRPGAVLSKKMASLNANTTAARKSAFSLANTPDFMNEYGDIVVTEVMKANPEIHARLDFPLETAGNLLSSENAISKVTGRIPLLPLAEQEAIYDSIEKQYTEYVARQEALGESILEASTLNLDARMLSRMEVLAADVNSRSPFTSPVYAEIADVKNPQKPYTTLQVINSLRQTLSLPEVHSITSNSSSEIIEISQQKVKQEIADLEERADKYRLTVTSERAAGVDNHLKQVSSILSEFPVGQPVCLTTDKQERFYGVVSKMKHNNIAASPVAPSAWEIKLLVADSVRELSIPLSQVNTGKERSIRLIFVNQTEEKIPVYDLFDHLQSRTREKRQIFTGNLLRAWEKFPGRMINFTDAGGNIRQGLLTPRGFDCENALEKMPIKMPTIEDASRFLTEYGGQLKTGDEKLTIKQSNGGDCFIMQTPKGKDEGGKYFLDEKILEIIQDDFYSVSDRMACQLDKDKLEPLLEYLMGEKGYSLAAYEMTGAARAMLGVELPSFSEAPPTPEPFLSNEPNVQEGTGDLLNQHDNTDIPVEDNFSFNDTVIETTPSPQQRGTPEKNIAKLLERGGLLQTVMESDDFHLRIENEPYIPLVIERHGNEMYLTHYLSENGDVFIDSEMVFTIAHNGSLRLKETATSALGQEWRNCDRSYATMFSKNLLDQGFPEAIKNQLTKSENAFEQHNSENTDQIQSEPLPDAIPPPSSGNVAALFREGKVFDVGKNSAEIIEPTFSPGNTNNHSSQIVPLLEDKGITLQNSEIENSLAPTHNEFDLETWLQAVHDLGLESERSHHIENIQKAQESNKDLTVSSYLTKIIEGDVGRYRPYQERGSRLLNTVQLLLAEGGQLDIWGGVTLKHNRYECVQKDDVLTVQVKKGNSVETILQAKGDRIERTTVKQADVDQFNKLAEHLGVITIQQLIQQNQR